MQKFVECPGDFTTFKFIHYYVFQKEKKRHYFFNNFSSKICCSQSCNISRACPIFPLSLQFFTANSLLNIYREEPMVLSYLLEQQISLALCMIAHKIFNGIACRTSRVNYVLQKLQRKLSHF